MLIARANFRRARGQTTAIALLVLLAALMLNLWLMLSSRILTVTTINSMGSM